MPRIQPYVERIEAKGHNADFQDPDTADAGLGAAARSIGNSVGRLVRQHQAVEDDQGRMWAANATAQNEVAQQKVQADRINSLDPSAPDYVDKVNALPDVADADYQASTQQLMEDAPNNAARKYVTIHAAGGRVRTMASSINTTADLNASYAVSQVDQSVKSNSDIIAGSPDNATFEDINGRNRQTIMDLTTIDPKTKLRLADQSTHQFSLTQVQATAAINPTAFLQLVNAQGGITTRNGVRGAVPGGTAAMPQQPEMLAFANQQIAAGKAPEEALQTAMADPRFKDVADKFRFQIPKGGTQFVDMGAAPVSGDPQVQPLGEDAIAVAKPPIAGWDNLTWSEKVAAVRGAESAAGKSLAEDRGGMTRELRDASATLLTGQAYPDLNSPRFSEGNLTRLFGEDEGHRAAIKLQNDQQVGQYVANVAAMPVAQAQAQLDQLKPQAGATGFADAQARYRVAAEATARAWKAQQKAPIETAIQQGIAGAKPLDFSDPKALPSQLAVREQASLTMQRDYGTKPQIFTKAEVEQLADRVNDMTGKDTVTYLASLRTGLTSDAAFSTAMQQLAPKNPNLAYAANMAVKPGTQLAAGRAVSAPDIAATIVDGEKILNGRTLTKHLSGDQTPDMPGGARAMELSNKNFSAMFDQKTGGAFQSVDGQYSAANQQTAYNAVKAYYAARAYAQNKPLSTIDSQLMDESVTAVLGTPWKTGKGGVLLPPFGVPVDTFQRQWQPRARLALKAGGYTDDEADRILDSTTPVNAGDGVYRFQNGTRMQTVKGGSQKITVDFHQAYQEPAVPVGGAYATHRLAMGGPQ